MTEGSAYVLPDRQDPDARERGHERKPRKSNDVFTLPKASRRSGAEQGIDMTVSRFIPNNNSKSINNK